MKTTKRFTAIVAFTTFLVSTFLISLPASALPDEVIADLEMYAAFWQKKGDEAKQKRDNNFPYGMPERTDSRYFEYVGLSRVIFDGDRKSEMYIDASKTKDGMIHVIAVTVANSATDMAEMAQIMFSWELIENIVDKKWTDILKSAYDAMFRMKIRKMVSAHLGCPKPAEDLEDHLMGMVNPEVKKSTAWEAMEKGTEKGLDKLKEKYKDEAEKQFKKKWLKKTKGMAKGTVEKMAKKMGEEVMEKATSAIDAVTFTADIAQKIYFWNEYEPTIRQTVEAVGLRKQKYAENNVTLSCKDAYLVWAGKKEIPLPAGTIPPETPSDSAGQKVPSKPIGDTPSGGSTTTNDNTGNGSSGGNAGSASSAGSLGNPPDSTNTNVGNSAGSSGDSGTTGSSTTVPTKTEKAFLEFVEAKTHHDSLPPGKEKEQAKTVMSVKYTAYMQALKSQ